MHDGRWSKAKVIYKQSGFQCEGHTLKDHLLRKVFHPKGRFTEAIDEGPQCLIFFLHEAEKG